MRIKDDFPVLGINDFRDVLQTESSLLYHEIHGERHIEKPHKHDFFVFLLFDKGSGVHSIDFTDYKIRGRQLHLLFPDQVHSWHLGKNTSGYQLMVSRPVFETFSDSLRFSFVLYQNHPVIDLSPAVFQKILYEFRAVEEELALKPVQWGIVNLRSRLIAELVSREAERRFEDLTVYRTKPVLYKYHSLVDLHFRDEKSVAFYARQLHITPNYLNILCKRHFNVPATFLIQNRVVLEAKRLMQATEKSVKEIAFELGFSDLAYFSNFFKTQTGLSPKAFRGQL
ncbi:helix-turn-helix domain-containing protein [Niabella beijingensis]|uniref:helix-turn-helix domain-containing protein n=1 Tax=Niabella beijingensis TaxID=2872700 RepID=UPI001CC12C86|nr:helix-turn-helix transcriptional regulator [Niabella beijingensis]MBZ4188508.1 AraC family transcriptional regulator [Niabella beijingensis]